MQGIAKSYAEFHSVTITPEIARQCVVLSERYITDRYLPDKAIDLLDESAAELSLSSSVLNESYEVREQLLKLKETRDIVEKEWGGVDILVNCAGGNVPGAPIPDDKSVFDMEMADFEKVNAINMNGTVIPSIVFAESMVKKGAGSIITISSMASYSAITRVLGYTTAKHAIDGFTQWMAQEMAIKFT